MLYHFGPMALCAGSSWSCGSSHSLSRASPAVKTIQSEVCVEPDGLHTCVGHFAGNDCALPDSLSAPSEVSLGSERRREPFFVGAGVAATLRSQRF